MENKNVRTIGVLTSGGDAPGMNAAIRSVVRVGSYYGLKVFGVRRGYNGLINGELEEMNARSVSEILQRGGTILQTARCLEFKEEAGVRKLLRLQRYSVLTVLLSSAVTVHSEVREIYVRQVFRLSHFRVQSTMTSVAVSIQLVTTLVLTLLKTQSIKSEIRHRATKDVQSSK